VGHHTVCCGFWRFEHTEDLLRPAGSPVVAATSASACRSERIADDLLRPAGSPAVAATFGSRDFVLPRSGRAEYSDASTCAPGFVVIVGLGRPDRGCASATICDGVILLA
jgi:hypothetical protein